MLKRLAAVVGAVLLCASTVWGVVNYNDRTVTRLWNEDGSPLCTGFFVAGPDEVSKGFTKEQKFWVMTAKHCVSMGVTAGEDTFSPKQTITWAKMFNSDVALGLVSYTQPHLLKIAKEFPDLGEMVFVHGFGLGVENIVAGYIDENDPRVPQYKIAHMVTGDIWPGNSGSPVLNEKGEVIGLASALLCKEGQLVGCMMRHLSAVDTRAVAITPVMTFAYPTFWPDRP